MADPSAAGETAPPSRATGRPYRKRRGRPAKARGQPNSSDAASARWTIRGVPSPVRDMALHAAEARGMNVGDWVAEAIVAFARAAEKDARAPGLPATEPPPDLVGMIQRLDERLSRLEERQNRSFFGRLFGRQKSGS